MAGPGGREVARVSARVVPDTSGFARELKRALEAIERDAKIEVGAELDTKGLRTELATALKTLGGENVDIGVDADTTKAAAQVKGFVNDNDGRRIRWQIDADSAPASRVAQELRKRLESLATRIPLDADPRKALAEFDRLQARARTLNATVDIDADTARALTEARAAAAAIDRMKATIDVDVDVDRRGLGGAGGAGGFGAIGKVFGELFQLGSRLPGMFGSIASGLGSMVSVGSSAVSTTGSLVEQFGGLATGGGKGAAAMLGVAGAVFAVVGIVTNAITTLISFGAQLALIAVIAGAVTAAVGAVGALASGLPAALFAVAGAGAAVALGFDGIKKAAEAAKPGLDRLKAAVSDTFQRELTPMFRDLGERVLPQVTVGFQGVAVSVSNTIRELLGVFTSVEGIRQLNVVLANTRVFLDALTPGLKGLLQGLLSAAQTTGAFRLLGEIIGGVAQRIGDLFQKFAAGGEASLMTRGLEQLRNVTFSVVDVISTLILKATEFFTRAGPGLQSFFDSINRTLQEIDFGSLGESFGRFAAVVGGFIDRVPPETWQRLTDAVAQLVLKFEELGNDPNIQQFFNFLIGIIPGTINLFTMLLGAARAAFNGIRTAALTGAQIVVDALLNIVRGIASVVLAMPGIPDSVRTGIGTALGYLGGLSIGITNEMNKGAKALSGAAPAFGAGGAAAGAAGAGGVKDGVSPLPGHAGAAAGQGAGQIAGQQGAFGAAGQGAGAAAAGGVQGGVAPIPQHAGGAARSGSAEVSGTSGLWSAAGRALIQGLASAISGGGSSVISAAISVARGAIAAAKRALGIASPSKVFAYLGRMTIAGYTGAITGGVGDVRSSMDLLARDVIRQGELLAGNQVFLTAGQSIGAQLGAGMQTGVQAAFTNLPNVVKLGTVSDRLWEQLLASGWKGRAGDGMEALYRPARAAATAPTRAPAAAAGGGAAAAGDLESAVERAMSRIEWAVELSPEGVAKLANRGNRSLNRVR